MPEAETLGQRIRRIRHQRGMSLASVGGEDFTRAFLNQVEMGKARPSVRVLRVIAERLGTDVDYLLEGRQGGVDREVSLEKARVLYLKGQPQKALQALASALESFDYPLGADARLVQAQALMALGKKDEATTILWRQKVEIEAHDDTERLEKVRAIQEGHEVYATGDRVQAHLQLADRAERLGRSHDALEHYRAARVLLEA
ncbi:MAG TPA: helix-turn-helix domain-containing protein, partial [Candidatus Dormibacteraeota bacterium]|nr:helix-turn-helix domain-containing protein [Candidatus Dormibacteraeota bacterium]